MESYISEADEKKACEQRVEHEKNETEVLAERALWNAGAQDLQFKDAVRTKKSGEYDCRYHTDIMAKLRNPKTGKYSVRFIDVKSVTQQNAGTGNCCLSKALVDEIVSREDNNMDLMPRISVNGRLTDDFLYVSATEVVDRCVLTEKQGSKGLYYLVSINDIKRNCEYKILSSGCN